MFLPIHYIYALIFEPREFFVACTCKGPLYYWTYPTINAL